MTQGLEAGKGGDGVGKTLRTRPTEPPYRSPFEETAYLLGFSWRAQDAPWQLVTRGALSFLELDEADVPRVREIMERYRDLPMDLADAALVRVAERVGIERRSSPSTGKNSPSTGRKVSGRSP